MPKVSVIVPVYKAEQYIDRCLQSIINQTYRDIEIVIIDDGSPDNCGTICDKYAEKDNRIVVIHTQNNGVAVARNLGLKKAKGKYISFVDADDYIANNAIEVLYKKIEAENADIVCCNHYACFDDGKNAFIDTTKHCDYTTQEIKEKYIMDHWLNILWDKLMKSELFDGLEFEKGLNYEDTLLVPVLVCRANKIVCVKDALYFYNRTNYSSITNNFTSRELFAIYRGWKKHLELAEVYCYTKAVDRCTAKMKKFAKHAYCVNIVDSKLSAQQMSELIEIGQYSSGVLTKCYGFWLGIRYPLAAYVKRSKTIYDVWTKIKSIIHR